MDKITKFKNIFYFLFFILIGLIYFFYPLLINSGLMPGDLGDGRFINYVLEHGFLFLKQVPIHSSFWDMPIFYPNENTLAYSDVLLGGMIIYTPIRLFFNPHTSLQIWLFIVCILNYLSMYLLLNKIFKFKPLSCAIGAFIFAFSLPRYSQIFHMQLYLQFYSIFALLSFFSVKKENSMTLNCILLMLGTSLFAMQLYTSFYLGWFLTFALVLSIFICLCYKDLRNKLIDFIKFYKFELLACIVFFGLLIFPLCLHYLAVGSEFSFNTINFKITNFFVSESLLDAILMGNNYIEIQEYEENIGIGFMTTIAILLGIFFAKGKRKFIISFITITILIFSSTIAREMLYNYFLGASAIRVSSRIIFLLLIFFSYLIAQLLEKIKNKWLLFFVVLVIIFEQFSFKYHFEWSKNEHYTRLSNYHSNSKCKILNYYIYGFNYYKYLLDIMWYATNKNVYTINGYSGYRPMPTSLIFEGECEYIIPKQSEEY